MSTLSTCTMSIYFGHKLSKIWSVNIFLKISNGYLIHLSETNSVTLKPRSQINYEHKKQQIIGVGNLDIPEYQDSWGYSNISGRVRVPVWHWLLLISLKIALFISRLLLISSSLSGRRRTRGFPLPHSPINADSHFISQPVSTSPLLSSSAWLAVMCYDKTKTPLKPF